MTLSARDQFEAMLREMQAGQKAAVQELGSYLGSEEALSFVQRLDGFRLRTVPGSAQEQALKGVLSVLESLRKAIDVQISLNIKQAERAILSADADIAADTVVLAAEPELVPDAPLAEEAPVDLERDNPESVAE